MVLLALIADWYLSVQRTGTLMPETFVVMVLGAALWAMSTLALVGCAYNERVEQHRSLHYLTGKE